MSDTQDWWHLELEGMPDFEMSMKRVYAWFEGAIIDRPPVRFVAHNAFVEQANTTYPSPNLKDRWFDEEFQVKTFMQSIEAKRFHGETFPVFWPNLGPEVYSAFFGSVLEYGDVTAWSVPLVREWDDISRLKLDMENEYFRKIEALTHCALEHCRGKFLVGYTDLHPGADCAAAWRDPAQLCIDMLESPDETAQLIDIANREFARVYDHFDAILKAHQQPSITWMAIPSFGKMHIPSCDFSALISPKLFDAFCLPILEQEVKLMTHNIFHVDGRGVARHLDKIMAIPEVHAIQWVQGVGSDLPIMQWVDLIKRVQARLPIVVDLKKEELDPFMAAVKPEGIFLSIGTESESEELEILKRLERWK
jgi:hypothetical protein